MNKSRIGETDGPAALTPVAPATGGARVWGTTGADGRVIEPPPGTPPGTPGAYDEKGMPHVALTQGTNQLPQKANAELDQAAVKAITESRAKAEGAIGTIAAINRQKEAIDKGIVSGAGADWRTQARAVAAQVLGIPNSYVTQSQLFDQAATQKSAELAKQSRSPATRPTWTSSSARRSLRATGPASRRPASRHRGAGDPRQEDDRPPQRERGSVRDP